MKKFKSDAEATFRWFSKCSPPLPFLLTFMEKDGDRFFLCDSPTKFERCCFYVLKMRFEEGFYSYTNEIDQIKEIINNGDLWGAVDMLLYRRPKEYERFDWYSFSELPERSTDDKIDPRDQHL